MVPLLANAENDLMTLCMYPRSAMNWLIIMQNVASLEQNRDSSNKTSAFHSTHDDILDTQKFLFKSQTDKFLHRWSEVHIAQHMANTYRNCLMEHVFRLLAWMNISYHWEGFPVVFYIPLVQQTADQYQGYQAHNDSSQDPYSHCELPIRTSVTHLVFYRIKIKTNGSQCLPLVFITQQIWTGEETLTVCVNKLGISFQSATTYMHCHHISRLFLCHRPAITVKPCSTLTTVFGVQGYTTPDAAHWVVTSQWSKLLLYPDFI